MSEPTITPAEGVELEADPLHPTGYCKCGGEGRCEWCVTMEERIAKMKPEERAFMDRGEDALFEIIEQDRAEKARLEAIIEERDVHVAKMLARIAELEAMNRDLTRAIQDHAKSIFGQENDTLKARVKELDATLIEALLHIHAYNGLHDEFLGRARAILARKEPPDAQSESRVPLANWPTESARLIEHTRETEMLTGDDMTTRVRGEGGSDA